MIILDSILSERFETTDDYIAAKTLHRNISRELSINFIQSRTINQEDRGQITESILL